MSAAVEAIRGKVLISQSRWSHRRSRAIHERPTETFPSRAAARLALRELSLYAAVAALANRTCLIEIIAQGDAAELLAPCKDVSKPLIHPAPFNRGESGPV